MNESQVLWVVIVAMAVIAVYFIVKAVRLFQRRRLLGGFFGIASALFLALAAVCVGLVGFGLQGFQRLTYERTAVEVQFAKTAEGAYIASVRYPGGAVQDFTLQGDDWQVDARILSFKPLASILGFDSAYRLERLSGRYRNIEDERSKPRTVQALHAGPGALDLWDIVRRYRDRAPWVDAYQGTAAYVPMADGARYAVAVTQGGLKARPMNEAAKQAVGNWQ